MKYLNSFLILISFSLFAETENWTYVKTPRGTDLEIKITKSIKASAPFLIVAPGQSCNSKGSLFETIEQEAIKKQINVVRFEWSYCSLSSTNRNPSNDLNTEISDMDFAISYSRDLLQKQNTDLLIAGKSLGSMVAYQIFKNNAELKSLTLLTPVCSYSIDEQGKPLPASLDVIKENYPDLLLETRPVLMVSGSRDSLCDHLILKNFNAKAPRNFNIIYTNGDHGFRVFNTDGSLNQLESQNIQLNVSVEMLNWFSKP